MYRYYFISPYKFLVLYQSCFDKRTRDIDGARSADSACMPRKKQLLENRGVRPDVSFISLYNQLLMYSTKLRLVSLRSLLLNGDLKRSLTRTFRILCLLGCHKFFVLLLVAREEYNRNRTWDDNVIFWVDIVDHLLAKKWSKGIY